MKTSERLALLIATEQASRRHLDEAGRDAVKSARMGDHGGLALFRTNAIGAEPDADPDSRTIRYTWCDESTNDYGDIVRSSGWDLTRYATNPIALWMHDMERPIGMGVDFGVSRNALRGGIQFAAPGTSELVDTTFGLAAQGILRAVSVGFDPLERKWHDDDEERMALGLGPFGVEITRAELWEISMVSVGANRNALVEQMKSLRIEDDTVRLMCPQMTERDWAQRARLIRGRTHALSAPDPIAALSARIDALEHEIRDMRTLAASQRALDGARARADADGAEALEALSALEKSARTRAALSALDTLTARKTSKTS